MSVRTQRALSSILAIAAAAGLAAQAQPTSSPLQQQPPSAQRAPARDAPGLPRGTASISGTVVLDAPEPTPLRRVTLTLSGAELGPSRVAVSDDAGRFAFAGLPAGRFTLTGARAGYVPVAYGATGGPRSQGVPMAVADGQTVDAVTLRMLKGGVVTGRVTDEHVRPVPGAAVVIGELRSFSGEMRFVAAPGPPEWTTDDRGVFRAYGLAPGTFVVFAENQQLARRTIEPTPAALADWVQQSARGTAPPAPMPGPTPGIGFVPVFHPGTPDPSLAARVTLAAGEERAGVDIAMIAVPYATISGRVTLPGGTPAAGVELFAFPAGGVVGIGRLGIPPFGASDARGEFTVRSVAPGRYTLLAQAEPAPAAGTAARGAEPPRPARSGSLWARSEVVVDGRNITGVSLQLLPGATISGRVVFENQPAPLSAELRRTTVRVAPPPGAPGAFITLPPAAIALDGTFTIADVGPGSYLVSVAPPGSRDAPSWMPLSIAAGGRDLLASTIDVAPGAPVAGVEIALTDRVTTLSGMLQDASGRPAPEYFVLAFPVDRRLWTLGGDRLRPPARPSSDGRYRLAALLPGEYYVAALTAIQPADHLDPLFLEQLVPAAIRVTIGVGEQKVQDLRIQ